MQIRSAIIGEYKDYKRTVKNNSIKAPESDVSRTTDNVLINSSWCAGESGYYEEILSGSHVDDNPDTPDEIKKHYRFSTRAGPAKDVEIQYVEQNDGGKEVITKKSTDLLKKEVLSWEKVDATTGEVMEEWFIPDHKYRTSY